MKEFHFNGELARRYGVDEAVFLHSLVFWVEKNRANGRNFHDGRYWTYNSKKALARLFPFWTERQLDRIIASCKEQGAVLTGNYNQDGRDRTIWYAVSDRVLAVYSAPEPDQPVDCNPPIGEMQSTGCVDASHEPVKSYKEQLLTPVISPHKPPSSSQSPLCSEPPGGDSERRSLARPLPTQTASLGLRGGPDSRGGRELPAESRDKLERYVSGKPELAEALNQYLDTRRANRKAVKTAATVDLILRKLDKLSGGDDQTKIAILEQSVERSWTGLFALDRDTGQGARSSQNADSCRVYETEEVGFIDGI